MVRQGCGRAFLQMSLQTKCVRLQSFERGGSSFGQRNIKPLHGGQRLAQFSPQPGCSLAHCVEHFLFGRCRGLLLGQRVAGLAIHSLQLQHVLTAQISNLPGEVSLAARPLAKLAGHVGRELSVGRARH